MLEMPQCLVQGKLVWLFLICGQGYEDFLLLLRDLLVLMYLADLLSFRMRSCSCGIERMVSL